MGITETTQVVFSLGQFSSIISIVVLQTAFMVGIYWKMNKKIDDVDKKVDTNNDQIDDKIKTILSNASNQYLMVEKTFDNQEKSFLTKCESMEKQSQIRYETFSDTLRKTNEALDKVNKTTTELYTLIIKVKSDFDDLSGRSWVYFGANGQTLYDGTYGDADDSYTFANGKPIHMRYAQLQIPLIFQFE